MLTDRAKSLFLTIFVLVWMHGAPLSAVRRKEFDSASKGSGSCFERCLMLTGSISKSEAEEGLDLIRESCFNSCIRDKIRQGRGQRWKTQQDDDYIILDPKSPAPRDLKKFDVMVDTLPKVPKDFHEIVDPSIVTEGNCDVVRAGKVDSRLQSVVFSRKVSLSCFGRKDGVLVTWKRPLELRNCIGYQVNYRFGSRSGGGREVGRCFEVGKNVTSFLIDKAKGFDGQDELFLAIVALPLPAKCNIDMKKYSLCNSEKGKKRKRRDTTDKPTLGQIMTFPPPPGGIITIKPGQIVPTNLTFPSTVPDPKTYFGKDSNCERVKIGSTKDVYAGYAHVTKVDCQKAGKYNKKSFNLYWTPPKDYLTKNYTAFQILYTITQERVIPKPLATVCIQVSKDTLAYRVTGVESTDTIHVLVVAYPVYHQLNETMQTFTPCRAKESGGEGGILTNGLIAAIIVVAFITIVILIAIGIICQRKVKEQHDVYEAKKGKVYVSYYPDTENYENSVLNLVTKFRKDYGVNLVIDSYNQTEIAELGLSRWCQKQLSESEKILMVVSKEYLKICIEWKAGKMVHGESNDVNRVCGDLQFVVDRLFEKKTNSSLIIILADSKQNELPEFLRGKQIFSWPKHQKEFDAINCSILSQEAVTDNFQIEVADPPQRTSILSRLCFRH